MIGYADRAARDRPLYDMFTAIPRRYDLVNHVITWGLDSRWRRQAARECLARLPGRLLDLCCGTGDLALNLSLMADSDAEVVGVDYSQPMLDIANRKAEPLASRPAFVRGDAAALPFADEFFDCVGISFAFRNLTYKNPMRQRHIAEVLRVLRPGGRFVILETSQPKAALPRKAYHFYLRWFISRAGSLLSGNRAAYHYLAESAARFYAPDELRDMLVTAGFSQVSFHPLFFGAIGIYVAVK